MVHPHNRPAPQCFAALTGTAKREVAELGIGWGEALFSQTLVGLLPLSVSCPHQEGQNYYHGPISGSLLVQEEGKNSNLIKVHKAFFGPPCDTLMFWSRIWPNNMRTAAVPPGTLKLLDWKAWTECSAGAGDGFPSYSSSAISLGPDWKTHTAGIGQPAFYVFFFFFLRPAYAQSLCLCPSFLSSCSSFWVEDSKLCIIIGQYLLCEEDFFPLIEQC